MTSAPAPASRSGRPAPSGPSALLHRLEPLWKAGSPSVAARLEVVAAFAEDLRGLGPANFLYADGELLFAHSHVRRHVADGPIEPPGLHLLTRSCPCDRKHHPRGIALGDCREPQRVALFASVPLSEEGWTPIPTGAVVVARDGEVVARADAESS